jgi:hypothetical protein
LLPVESLTFDYEDRFARFDSVEDIPVEARLSAIVVIVPETNDVIAETMVLRRA